MFVCRIQLIGITSLILLSSCASYDPTPYQPKSTDGLYGYEVKSTSNGILESRFVGNQWTDNGVVLGSAIVSAYDYCVQKNLIPVILLKGAKNESTSFSYSQVYTSYIGDKAYVNSYPVTHTYPEFSVPFVCVEYSNRVPGLKSHDDLSKELVHPMTKDFRGGILVKEIDASLKTPLQVDDIIVKLDGKRVENYAEFSATIESIPPRSIKIGILRKRKSQTLTAELLDDREALKIMAGMIHKLACENLGKNRKESRESMRYDYLPASDSSTPGSCVPLVQGFATKQ